MTTQNLRSDLRRDEGDEKFPYRDSRGIWTIGTGCNMEVRPELMARLAELQANGITQAEDDTLLDEAIAAAEHGLDANISWWRDLDDVRQDCIANQAFNLGVHGLLGFDTYLGLVKAHDYAAAADDLAQTKWARQVGARAARIAEQMRTGVHAP